jgi:hypothetical protein
VRSTSRSASSVRHLRNGFPRISNTVADQARAIYGERFGIDDIWSVVIEKNSAWGGSSYSYVASVIVFRKMPNGSERKVLVRSEPKMPSLEALVALQETLQLATKKALLGEDSAGLLGQ